MKRTRQNIAVLLEQENLTALFAAFQTPKYRALTLSRRVALSPCVIDAQIIQATVEAAQAYGYAHPDELIGQWQSCLQHPRDFQLSRAMAIRRHFGYDRIPDEYVIQIRQGDTTRFRQVWKHTTQIDCHGETYWITIVKDTRAPLLADTLDIATQFPLPESDQIRRYSGIVSMAELGASLPGLAAPHQPQDDLTTLLFQPRMSALQTLWAPDPLQSHTSATSLAVPLGGTMALSDGTFLHRCGRCSVPWISRNPTPAKCPRQRADTRGPRCGKRTWRQVDAGQPHANPPA